MKNFRIIFIVLLCGITLFSLYNYVSLLKENVQLQSSLGEINLQIAALGEQRLNLLRDLEKEKQLAQELQGKNTLLKDNLKAGISKIQKLQDALNRTKAISDELNAVASILRAENSALHKDEERLNSKLSQINRENDNFKAKLNSVEELRKAINEVKKQLRKVAVVMIKTARSQRVIEGNRGYLVREGKSTYQSTYQGKVNIEVIPAPEVSISPF